MEERKLMTKREREGERGSRGGGREGRGKAGSERGRKKRRRSLIDQRGNEGESSAATPGTRQREREGSLAGWLSYFPFQTMLFLATDTTQPQSASPVMGGRRGRFLDGMETIGSGGEGKQTGSARDRQIERQTDGETAE